MLPERSGHDTLVSDKYVRWDKSPSNETANDNRQPTSEHPTKVSHRYTSQDLANGDANLSLRNLDFRELQLRIKKGRIQIQAAVRKKVCATAEDDEIKKHEPIFFNRRPDSVDECPSGGFMFAAQSPDIVRVLKSFCFRKDSAKRGNQDGRASCKPE